MENVVNKLNEKGIFPEIETNNTNDETEANETLNRIKSKAQEFLKEWQESKNFYETSIINIADEILEVENLEKNNLVSESDLNIKSEIFNKESEIEEKEEIEKSEKNKELKEEVKKEDFPDEDIYSFLNRNKIEYIDNTKTSKLLWIIYTPEIKEKMEIFLTNKEYKYSLDKRGANATNNRKAWRIKLEG